MKQILICGQSSTKFNDLKPIAIEKFNIKEKQLIYKNYEETKRINFDNLRNSKKIIGIIFGPHPHKLIGLRGYESIETCMDNEKCYPPYVQVRNLRLNVESFRIACDDLLEQIQIQQDNN